MSGLVYLEKNYDLEALGRYGDTGIFNWLNNLIERVLALFPTIQLVSPDECGVRVTLGKHVYVTPSGWYIVWPVIQTWEGAKVKTQIKDLRAQSVWSADHKELVISGAVKYYIADIRKALLEVFDYDANIQALALGVIQRNCATCNEADVRTPALEEVILAALREESRGWGIRVQQVYITDVGRARNIRLLTNTVSDKE